MMYVASLEDGELNLHYRTGLFFNNLVKYLNYSDSAVKANLMLEQKREDIGKM